MVQRHLQEAEVVFVLKRINHLLVTCSFNILIVSVVLEIYNDGERPPEENSYMEIFGFAIWTRRSLASVKNHLQNRQIQVNKYYSKNS